MHCLEVIILKNARAAGREEGHALADGARELSRRIDLANVPDSRFLGRVSITAAAYADGFIAGRGE